MIMDPDSGQNLETRIRPGGVLKAWSLAVLEVVDGSEGCACARSSVVVVSRECWRSVVSASFCRSAGPVPGSCRSWSLDGLGQLVVEAGTPGAVSRGAWEEAPGTEVSGS